MSSVKTVETTLASYLMPPPRPSGGPHVLEHR